MSRSGLFPTRCFLTLVGGLVLSGLLSMTAAAQSPFRADVDMKDMAPGDCHLPITPAEPCAAAAVYAAHLRELQQQPIPPPGRDQQVHFHQLQCLTTAFHQQQRVCEEAMAQASSRTGDRPLPPSPGPNPPIRIPSDDRPYEPVAPIDVGHPDNPNFCRTPQLEELAKRPCENVPFLDEQIRQASSQLPPPDTPMTGVQELRLRPLIEHLRCLQKWRQAMHQSCQNRSYKDEKPYEPHHPSSEAFPASSIPPGMTAASGGLSPSPTPSRGFIIQQSPGCDQLVRQFQAVQQRHQTPSASLRQGLFIQRQLQQIEMRLRQLCPEAIRVIRQN